MKIFIICFWIALYLIWSYYSIKNIIEYFKDKDGYTYDIENYAIIWIIVNSIALGLSSILYLVYN